MRPRALHNFGVHGQPQRGAIRFYNGTDQDIPPYYPVLFHEYNLENNPFQLDNGETLDSPVLPVLPGSGAVVGLPFINGSQTVGSQSYGSGTLQHPMKLAIDPDSFPIWNGDYNSRPTLGSAQDYIDAGQSGFPPLGFNPNMDQWGLWGPASFSPLLPCWQALCFDAEADGSLADDRVLAVPFTGEDFPFAGANQFGVSMPVGTSPIDLVSPIPVIAPGLYQLTVTCSIGIDVPGAAVTLTINYTPGVNAPNGAGATVSWGSGYRQTPNISVGGGSGGGDDDSVSYQTTGAESVTIITTGFAFQGDQWNLVVSASEDCNPVLLGTIAYTRTGRAIANSTFGGLGGWWGGYWSGWWGGYYGYGYGFSGGPGGLSSSWW